MKFIPILCCGALLSGAVISLSAQNTLTDDTNRREQTTQIVVVNSDDSGVIEVEQGTIIRIEAQGFDGSNSRLRVVEGNAKISRQALVIDLEDGEISPGSGTTEFEILPTETGQLEIELIEKFDGEGSVKDYSFVIR